MDRRLCLRCRQPAFSCFCENIRTFDPKIKFVILIHPLEARRRIATGRMSHLCLENSELIEGHDFSENQKVTSIIEDPANQCFLLYPGHLSTDITGWSLEDKATLIAPQKRLTLFVVDGTWGTARKMVHLSRNLHAVKRIAFTPPHASRFRVRKQPMEHCFSTIEAIHHSIELLAPLQGFDIKSRFHDRLLSVFDHMVEQQLSLMDGKNNVREGSWRSLSR